MVSLKTWPQEGFSRNRSMAPSSLVITIPNVRQTLVSDYNAFDIPNGAIGALANISTQGYALPSPPVATTLNQWRALSGQDMNSVSGDVTREFVSTTPGSENLHIQPSLLGSIVGNRGTIVTGMTQDIDQEPRGASSVAGRFDITERAVFDPNLAGLAREFFVFLQAVLWHREQEAVDIGHDHSPLLLHKGRMGGT